MRRHANAQSQQRKFISVDAAESFEGSFISMLLPIATSAPTIPLASWNQCSPQAVQKPGPGTRTKAGGTLGRGLVGHALITNVVQTAAT